MTDTKIIALDLDDTLLKTDLTISDYTVSVLQKAAAQGIYIVLCSGRTENAILPFVKRLDIAGSEFGRYIISQNGSTTFDIHKRLPIFENFVKKDILTSAYHIIIEEGFTCEVYDASTIYAPIDNEWTQIDKKLSGLKLKIIPDYEAFLQSNFPKMIIPGDPEKLQNLQKILKSKYGNEAVIFISKPYFLEILPKNCGKGEALKKLAEDVLHIPQEKTMCFGDSMNDESMIRYAAHGTAMINGLEYIKKIAKHVTTKTNDEDGAAHFIEENCFSPF